MAEDSQTLSVNRESDSLMPSPKQNHTTLAQQSSSAGPAGPSNTQNGRNHGTMEHYVIKKISSIVILVTVLGIAVGLLYFQRGLMEDVLHGQDAVTIMLTVVTCCSLIAIIFMFWVLGDSRSIDKMMFLKVVSSILFTIGCVLFFAFKIQITIECTPIIPTKLFNEIIMIIFYVLQTLLFVLLVKKPIHNNRKGSLIKTYGAVVLVATNTSIFVFNSFNFYDEERKKLTSNVTVHVSECHNSSEEFAYDNFKPYLEPCIIENSLLALLYIKEFFSEEIATSNYCKIKCKIVRMGSVWKKIKKNEGNLCGKSTFYITFILVDIFIFGYMVYYLNVKQYNDNNDILLGQAVVASIYKCIIGVFLVICFIFTKKSIDRSNNPTDFTLNHYLILLTTIGAIAYFFVNLISAGVKNSPRDIVLDIFNIVTTIYQTFLVIFLKDYKKFDKDSHNFVFAFLALSNFTLWFYNTFFEAQWLYTKEYSVELIGIETWHDIRHAFIPLTIFYRFKCFLSFFELFLRTEEEEKLLAIIKKYKSFEMYTLSVL